MKDKILHAVGAELSRLLGEVLQSANCAEKCGYYTKTACSRGYTVDNCPYPRTHVIPLDDWNVAMQWRDWAVEEYGNYKFEGAMVKVKWPDINLADETAEGERVMTIAALSFFAKRAKPKHYLQAAAICKVEAE